MQSNEEIISEFMQKHYTDERLSWLLAHAESGALSFWSCCCFIGIPTADHALRGSLIGTSLAPGAEPHYRSARLLAGAKKAESAFLGLIAGSRNPTLIGLIKQEMARREAERSSSSPELEHVMAQ